MACFFRVGIPFLFWGSVGIYWLIIKSLLHMPYYITLMAILVGVIGFFVSLATLDICSKIVEFSAKATRKIYLNALLFHAMAKSPRVRKGTKVSVMIAKALRPLKVPYGDFVMMDKGFGIEFFNNLFSWVLNVLLIF